MKTGVFIAKKKDGTTYYRSSFTYKNKHISLGSFATQELAHLAYKEALLISQDKSIELLHYNKKKQLSLLKWVCILNFRDNGMYFKTPIYLQKKYFEYYFSQDIIFKFDVDDLFFYSTHTIMRRGGHLFVADYGMQINILNRYGIKNFAVINKDYRFVNGDTTDFRHSNIDIINHFYGVTKEWIKGKWIYTVKIHINGDYIIGRYSDISEAAIAYNKAADILNSKGVDINFYRNYLDNLNSIEYAAKYNLVRISKKIRDF